MNPRTTDYHTAGEPFRIVVSDIGELAGATVQERRDTAAATERIDGMRRLLCHEPRGQADMYGCFVVPPDDEGANFGVLFWHKDGYSTACGHGTIALGAWAVNPGASRRPRRAGRPVEGLLAHVAGQGEKGFRVVDVWEWDAAFPRFGETLMPILQEIGVEGQPGDLSDGCVCRELTPTSAPGRRHCSSSLADASSSAIEPPACTRERAPTACP